MKLQIYVYIVVFFVTIVRIGNTQEEFLDDTFLDDSFSVEQKEENDAETFDSSERTDTDTTDTISTISPTAASSTMLLSFSIEERLFYTPVQRNESSLNKDKHIFVTPLKNTMLLGSFIQYRNAERWFKFLLDYRLFLEGKDKEWDTKSDVFDIETFLGLEINEAFVDVSIADVVNIKVGKSQFRSGSAFIVNPSNPLVYKPGEYTAWVKRLQVPNYASNVPFPAFDFPVGSKDEIGAWQFSTNISTSLMFIEFAYLPKLETGFREFDRPYHSFLGKVSYAQWYAFVPSLIYFYDDSSFIGADISATLNDDITVHTEWGMSFENELRRIKKDATIARSPDTSVDRYSIKQEADDGIFVEGVVGVQYTLTVDSVSFFTLLFETYYNGKGLNNDDWQVYRDDLSALYKGIENRDNPFRASYTGLIGNSLFLYSPIRVRPLYFLLQLSRDDVFSRFSAQRFNIETTLVYSPFDTTFSWISGFEWEGVEVITLGTELQYNFGIEGGAFTELTDVFTIQIYSKLLF